MTPRASSQQLGLFQAPSAADDPVASTPAELDVNDITPMQALALLAELKAEAGG